MGDETAAVIPANTSGEATGWYVGRERAARNGDHPKTCRWQSLGEPLQHNEKHHFAVVSVPWMDQKLTWCLRCDGPLPEMWMPDYRPGGK